MPLSDKDTAAVYKVLILGDATVGKTALLRSLSGQDFTLKTRPTVAVDFVRKKFEVDGALIQLNVWDTAGQERFMSMTRQSYRNVKGIAIVYDITDRTTFTHLSFWLESINNCVINTCCEYESVPIILIGNKEDLKDQRAVSLSEAKKFAKEELIFDFFETSAKTGDNVYAAFQKLAYHVTEICNPKLMKSYHPKMLRPPDVTERRMKSSPSLSKRQTAQCLIDLKSDRVIYIPERYCPVGKHRHSMRKGNYKLSVRKKKKKKQKFHCQCCVIS